MDERWESELRRIWGRERDTLPFEQARRVNFRVNLLLQRSPASGLVRAMLVRAMWGAEGGGDVDDQGDELVAETAVRIEEAVEDGDTDYAAEMAKALSDRYSRPIVQDWPALGVAFVALQLTVLVLLTVHH